MMTGFHIKPVSDEKGFEALTQDISYTGPEAILEFFKSLRAISSTMETMFNECGQTKITPLTAEEQRQHAKAQICYMCEGRFLYHRSVKEFQTDWQMQSEASKQEVWQREEQLIEDGLDPDEYFDENEEDADTQHYWLGPKVRGRVGSVVCVNIYHVFVFCRS